MEDDPVKKLMSLNLIVVYQETISIDQLAKSILGYLEDIGDKEEDDSSPDIDGLKKKGFFDPRISWIAPNDVDYEGDSLCMYTLRDI